jgi:DNA mismatch repair ATPase MutS
VIILRDGARRLRTLRWTASWLRFDALSVNEIVGSLYEWANMLFLLDVSAYVLANSTLTAERGTMQQMFRALAFLDVAQSVARWRNGLAVWCVPTRLPASKSLSVTDAVHPLLADGVPNSLVVLNAGVLITGSNMSGKTTFVRTLGVNAVLAQSIGTVCAREWCAPDFRIRSSIGLADSLVEGKSYYLAEVESVRRMLLARESGEPHLFLLDELFRGTNTDERIAAGYATLDHLNRGMGVTVVATHDLELHALLGDAYVTRHFRESVDDGSLVFDYQPSPRDACVRACSAASRQSRSPCLITLPIVGSTETMRPRIRIVNATEMSPCATATTLAQPTGRMSP